MTDVRTPAAENPAVDLTPTTVTQGWNKHDTTWMLGLYGTAIGAGTCSCRSTLAWAASGR